MHASTTGKSHRNEPAKCHRPNTWPCQFEFSSMGRNASGNKKKKLDVYPILLDYRNKIKALTILSI